MYTQILSVFPSAVNIAQILGIIIASQSIQREVVEDILGTEEGELKLVLCGLSSLMEDEDEDDDYGGLISYVICWLFVRFKLFGPILCHSTGICKPAYCTELCPRYAIDSVLEVSNSYDLQPITIIHNHDRKSSITRILHTATSSWDFASDLPNYFSRSPKAIKEAIMTDIIAFLMI